ncbi:MAG: hypothetical protein LBV51_05860 [Acholeplasmatales bacterium]|jgi:hypothetical protein|nr:hypothetical protein [Acholeplasmatales bacterium]
MKKIIVLLFSVLLVLVLVSCKKDPHKNEEPSSVIFETLKNLDSLKDIKKIDVSIKGTSGEYSVDTVSLDSVTEDISATLTAGYENNKLNAIKVESKGQLKIKGVKVPTGIALLPNIVVSEITIDIIKFDVIINFSKGLYYLDYNLVVSKEKSSAKFEDKFKLSDESLKENAPESLYDYLVSLTNSEFLLPVVTDDNKDEFLSEFYKYFTNETSSLDGSSSVYSYNVNEEYVSSDEATLENGKVSFYVLKDYKFSRIDLEGILTAQGLSLDTEVSFLVNYDNQKVSYKDSDYPTKTIEEVTQMITSEYYPKIMLLFVDLSTLLNYGGLF